MPKQSRLDDDAFIYQPRKEQTEKEKLREMVFKDKVTYIWEYYKFHIIGVAAMIALIAYFIYGLLNPTIQPQFYAAIINNRVSDDVLDNAASEFADRLDLNLKRENIEFNTTFYYELNGQYTFTMQQALTTYISAKEIDVVIAPETYFQKYAYYDTFAKLSDELPTDIYSSLTDQFYLTDTEEDATQSDYGIYLSDTKLFKDVTDETDPYVLGIVINAPHIENTVEFVRYLFGDK